MAAGRMLDQPARGQPDKKQKTKRYDIKRRKGTKG